MGDQERATRGDAKELHLPGNHASILALVRRGLRGGILAALGGGQLWKGTARPARRDVSWGGTRQIPERHRGSRKQMIDLTLHPQASGSHGRASFNSVPIHPESGAPAS